jgi:catechol 2,3-dioxygenase-like lactoylglutathione lyase family enzyme
MTDPEGQTIELVQGNWSPHIAVNWYSDDDGNLIEVVREYVKRKINNP